MSEHETTRLSDYLDEELSAEARAEVEAHLAGCPECLRTLEELRAVRSSASALPDLPPERDLWPGIEARLSPRGEGSASRDARTTVIPFRRQRVILTVPQLIAAALALVLFSASAVWLALGAGPAATPGTDPVVATGPASPVTTVVFTELDRTIATLEAEYRDRRAELDPETIRVVERNLAIIDQAIAEARDALETDPSSGFLSTHLTRAMRQKMELLRRAASITPTET